MRKKWIVRKSDAATVRTIAQALGVSELTAKILYHRGIRDVVSAKNFLEPETAPFNDPFAMKGMTAAVERIVKAIDAGEKICVYGDYDVDGMSATSILVRALKKFGAVVEFYIPDRTEGYGLNIPALEKISAEGASLVVTVDCGITNEREISAVADKLDVIVTDHHLPALEKIRSAVAVVNPNQTGCPYPDKNLCGAGVAFKLCQALANHLRGVDVQNYTVDIEIAALATVADLVPLIGENRKITRMGLQIMRETNCIGLRALVNVSVSGDKKISAGHVAFQIAPRLNATGRMQSADGGVKLLLTEDADEALETARRLNKLNQQRKDVEEKILTAAEEIVRDMREKSGGDLSTLVIAGEGWPEGVIGLVASKLVEHYNLPTVILTTQDGKIFRGSCRSIPALHMKNALDTMANLFEQYGGHSQAAGLTVTAEHVAEFSARFDEYVRGNLTDEDFRPILHVDEKTDPSYIEIDIANEFERLEPYGIGNPRPVLAFEGVRGMYAKTFGTNGDHLSFTISTDSKKIRAVTWSMGNLLPLVDNEPIAITYEPTIDRWQGEVRIQCNVHSVEPVEIAGDFPDDNKLRLIYNFLRGVRAKTDRFDLCGLVAAFNERTGEKFSTYVFQCAIDIFEELGLLIIDRKRKSFDVLFSKRELSNSRTYRLGRREQGVALTAPPSKVIALETAAKRLSLMQ